MTASAINRRADDPSSQPTLARDENNANVDNKKKNKPAALALPTGSRKAFDPSPVKKRRVVDAGFDDDRDVADFARQLRGYSHEAQTVAVPTPVFAESSTSESLFGQKEHNPPNVNDSNSCDGTSRRRKDSCKAAENGIAIVAAFADACTPLSETDRRYKTALVGFETAMKEDPTSHATDAGKAAVSCRSLAWG